MGDTFRRWTSTHKNVKLSPGSQCNVAQKSTNIRELMEYLNAVAFRTYFIKFIDAIKWGYFSGWPVLTTTNTRKKLPKPEATTKFHTNQTIKTQYTQYRASRKGIQPRMHRPKNQKLGYQWSVHFRKVMGENIHRKNRKIYRNIH